jgi:hypothetical protein
MSDADGITSEQPCRSIGTHFLADAVPRGRELIVPRPVRLQKTLLFGFVLAFGPILLAQDAPDKTQEPAKTLVVNAKTVDAAVIQVNGRSYVDVEVLAQITNGVVTIEPNRIVLTIPVANSSAPADANAAAPAPQGLSKDFVRDAIAVLAEMREWRGAVGTMITYGLAVSGTWSQSYHDSVAAGLAEATAAAKTDADQNALVLLNNEFDKLAGWANDVIAARQSLNAEKTIDPNSLQNDPVLAKITECGQFLNAMLLSGDFSDSPSCH